MEKEMTSLQVAMQVIEAYLGKDLTPDGLYDLLQIHSGNKKTIRGHLSALATIFKEALEEFDNDREV